MTKQDLTIKDLTRRQIRYICFRLQTASEGGAKVNPGEGDIMELAYEIKDHMESQEDFGGWAKFARTWDVDDKAPLVAIVRTHSIQTEWNKILKEETKIIPAEPEMILAKPKSKKKKFLVNKLSEQVQEIKQNNPETEIVAKIDQSPTTTVNTTASTEKKGFWERFN